MTALPDDPDPSRTPGLEPGGGVLPGDTPPDTDQTSATANKDPVVRHKLSPAGATGISAIVVVIVMFAIIAVLLSVYLAHKYG